MTACIEVICPPGAEPGSSIDVEHDGHTISGVRLPDGVQEGDPFVVDISDMNEPVAFVAASPGDPVGDAPGGLGALAAELEGQRAIAASFFSSDDSEASMPPVGGSDVLAEALRLVLRSVARIDGLDELIEAHCAEFAGYMADGEQQLTWTDLHGRYVTLVESGIADALDELDCTAEELFEYARTFHSDGRNTEADRLLTRLLAMADYASFCIVMRRAHECPMSV
jgi:hypothetical protein